MYKHCKPILGKDNVKIMLNIDKSIDHTKNVSKSILSNFSVEFFCTFLPL